MNEDVVVVTGASTGIGRAIALHLDGLGFRVFAGVRRESDGHQLQREASARLEPLHLDITDATNIATAVDRVTQAVADSRFVGLVNNAGIAVASPLEFLGAADLRRQFEVNVVGHVQVTQAFLPLLRDNRGRIVFMSSLGGKVSQPMVGAYTASKHALEAIGDTWRMELRPWGVDVSIIEPGAVATPIWDKGLAAADALIDNAPPELNRLYGAAVDIVRAIAKHEATHGVSPQLVADACAHALTAKRPRTRYVVGRDAMVGTILKRLLPDRAMDALIFRQSGLPTNEAATAPRSRQEAAPVA